MEAVKGHPHSVDGVNLRVSQDHSTPLNSSHVQQKEFYPLWGDSTHGNLSSQLPKVFNSTGIVAIVGLEVVCHLDQHLFAFIIQVNSHTWLKDM